MKDPELTNASKALVHWWSGKHSSLNSIQISPHQYRIYSQLVVSCMYACMYVHTYIHTYLPKHNNSGHLRKATLSLPGTLPCCCLLLLVVGLRQTNDATNKVSAASSSANVNKPVTRSSNGMSRLDAAREKKVGRKRREKKNFLTRVPSYVKCIYISSSLYYYP